MPVKPPTLIDTPLRARRLALSLGLSVRVYRYNVACGCGRKPSDVWVLSCGGREVGTFVANTRFLRVGRVWKRVRSPADALRLAAREVQRTRGRSAA